MKKFQNPLADLLKFSKNRIAAIAKVRPVTVPELKAAAKIQREAEHFMHLPASKQNYKVASLKEEVELLKSTSRHYRNQSHRVDQLLYRAEMNLNLQLFPS